MRLTVDLSSQFIHMIQSRQRGRRLEVTGFARAQTPEGCVKNGIVVNAGALGDALRALALENGFRAKKLGFAVASPAISFHELTVPAVRPRELRKLLVEETSQLNPSKKESLMDYVILDSLTEEGARMLRVWCVIIPRTLVEGYREAALKGGFTPVSFDVAANAAYKAYLLDEQFSKESTTIFAGVREDEVCLSLFEGSKGRFYRGAPIAAAGGAVENEFILSSFVSAAEADAESRRERMVRTVSGQLSKLVQFQLMKNREMPVTRVCLCSDKAGERQLASELGELLRIEAAPAGPPAFVRAPDGFDYSEYFYAVGAAIRI